VNRYVTTIFLILISVVLLVAGFLGIVATTAWGQQFVTKQVNSYLAGKIKAPFRIGRVRYKLPDWIILEDVYFNTPTGDTLLAGRRMRVDLDMWGLLNNRVAINQVELERVNLNITRLSPGPNGGPPVFNFQHLLDAFDTGKPNEPADTVATPLAISLSGITLRDVRLRYADDVAGANVDAAVEGLRADFDKVDIATSTYRLKNVNISGLTTKARIYDGLPTSSTSVAASGDTLDLGLGAWKVDRAVWDIRVENADFATKGNVGRLRLESDYLYLTGERIGLRSVDLANSDISATLLKTTKAAAKKPASATSSSNGWRAALGRMMVANSRIRYDDQNAPRQRTGIDYSHLDLQQLSLNGQNLAYAPDRTAGQFRGGKFRERSGLRVEQLAGDVLYSNTLTSVANLLLQTALPNGQVGTLLRDRLVLRYDSLAQLSRAAEPTAAGRRAAGRVRVVLNLRQSRLAVSDLLLVAPFVAQYPPFTTTRTGIIRANAQASGTLAALNLPVFETSLLTGTRIRARGKLTDLTDPNRLGLTIDILEGVTNRADIQKLAPPGSLPPSIDLPPSVQLTGRLRGQLNNLVAQSAVARTAWGTAGFSGKLAGFVSGKNPTYGGTVSLDDFDAGKWLKDPKQFGKITGRANFNGRGLDPNTLQTSFRADVDEATVNGYRYQQLNANGQLAGGILTLKGSSNDPNARLTLNTRVNLTPGGKPSSGKSSAGVSAYPAISGQVAIEQLDLQKLGFYADPLEIRGNLDLALTSTDPTRPEGSVVARNASIRLKGQTYPIEQLVLRAVSENGRRVVTVQSPFAQLRLDGQFDYTRLYDIVAGEISRYFTIPELAYKPVPPPYDFSLRAKIYQSKLLQAFVPALSRLDTVRLTAYLDNKRDTSLSATLTTGLIEYDTIQVRGSSLALRAANGALQVSGQINGVRNNDLNIGRTTLTGNARNNRFDFRVVSKDSVNADRHAATGNVRSIGGNYQLRLADKGLLTNYVGWQADTAGYLQYGKAGILADNFVIRSGRQTITVSSTERYGNAPLRLSTDNVELANLARIASQDTTLASGLLNGTVVVRDYATGTPAGANLSFFGSFFVDSLRVMDKPIGNLSSRFTNADNGRVGVNVDLSGPFNDADLSGFYNPNNTRQALDFKINLKRLDARTIEAFSFGELRGARGQLTGQVSVDGAVNQPRFDGAVAFDSVAFNIRQLNATYRIDEEQLTFNGPTITLNNFAVTDTLNRTLTTDGTVTIRKLPDVAYDLRVKADEFQVLNAVRKDNDYAYGQARVSANLRIRGSGTSPSIVGDVKLEDDSKITIVLPDQTSSINQARDVVTFIDHRDTLALAKYLLRPKADSLRPRLAFDELSKANISLNLEATEKSELTIILDELNGDNLRARGNARLNVGLDAAGNISVAGRYEITEGVYALTYEVLKRQFQLQPGGSITFSGDPYKAEVDITAVYQTKADPSVLTASASTGQTVTGQKLPFNVELGISGNIAKPVLRFDVTQPKGGSFAQQSTAQQQIENELANRRRDQSQINKQVFGLLLLNSFIADNISDSFSGGSGGGIGGSAENLARSSVSEILSEQLQQFASGLIKGVDVDLNLLSSGASGKSQTNLNVGLSKNFLNGRLSVSVGRNFALDNNQSIGRNPAEVFDNISLNYKISRDGRYALRAYRRNNFQSDQAIVEGYVIETGVGFVVTVDYNTLQEMFSRRTTPPQPLP
jgi:translocation and assembly module TamB